MTAPRPRDVIGRLPAYVPGRPPAEGAFKLSSNENPHDPLAEVIEAVNRTARTLNRYPDMGATAMYDALAARLGVRPESLASGTGSTAMLYNLVMAFCDAGDRVVYPWRSFEAYPIAIAVPGAVGVPVPLRPDATHDLDGLAAAIDERTRIVVLCSPNNPTGPALSHTDAERFVERVPDEVVIVIDEAYREFVRMDDALDGLRLHREHDNVVLTRTFAKAYGLAGLRVGFIVAHPEVARAVRACALPFGVSSLAQAAAVESLRHEEVLLRGVDDLVAERDRVRAAAIGAGWEVPDAQGNFLWFPVGDRVAEFAQAAEQEGITVRPFPGDGVRVSIGIPEANDRVVRVAQKITQEAARRPGPGDG